MFKFFHGVMFMVLISGCVVSCKKDDPSKARHFWTEGMRLLDAGQTMEGLQFLERAYARDPTYEAGLVYLSKAYIQSNNPKQASTVLAGYLSRYQGEAATWYMLALSRYSERKFNAAVESLEEALNLRPRFPEATLLLGTIYEEYEEFAAAISAYSQIADDLSLGKPLVPVLLRLVNLLQKKPGESDAKKIEGHLLSALELSPKDPDVLQAMGKWYLQQKEHARAAKLFQQWVLIDPQSSLAHYHAGLGEAAAGRHQQAISSYKRAVAIDPDQVDLHLAMADSYTALKDQENLYNTLVAASAADPGNLLVKWRLLPFYIDKGRTAVAETLFEELATERGTDPEFFRLRVIFHQSRGEYRLAYENHMSLLTITGKATDAFLREAGFLARYAGMYDKAVEILKPLATAFLDDLPLRRELALALWFSGKTNEGLRLLEQPGPKEPLSLIWLAYLYLQTPGRQASVGTLLREVEPRLSNTEEKLFYYDVMNQWAKSKKDWNGSLRALEAALPLARHEEERNTLSLALETLKKEMKPSAGTSEKPTPPPGDNHHGK